MRSTIGITISRNIMAKMARAWPHKVTVLRLIALKKSQPMSRSTAASNGSMDISLNRRTSPSKTLRENLGLSASRPGSGMGRTRTDRGFRYLPRNPVSSSGSDSSIEIFGRLGCGDHAARRSHFHRHKGGGGDRRSYRKSQNEPITERNCQVGRSGDQFSDKRPLCHSYKASALHELRHWIARRARRGYAGAFLGYG